jgi:glycosyltransferase involved in cell wall biosynthesis
MCLVGAMRGRPIGMHILMIAPEPFFEPRGTPFSEFHRIRALGTLGHTVDLATYPFGQNVTLPGLRVFRAMKPPFVSRVGIGPSWAKLPLNILLTFTVLRLALTRKYDAVHSHEEGGGIGVVIAWLLGVPHLYDMHSSLPQQVSNFRYTGMPGLAGLLGWLERFMIRGSDAVIVICQDLEGSVRAVDKNVPVVLIENAPGGGTASTPGAGAAIRSGLAISPETALLLYTGTFEHYQGLDLLYSAMADLVRTHPEARLVMVGGEPSQVNDAKAEVQARGIEQSVVFVGQRPPAEMPAYLDAATALVSPRSTGTNTPLKIYQYLRSGRPIVATNLRTHTQVLNDTIAVLADPTPAAFAEALRFVIDHRAAAEAIGARAKTVAEVEYSDEAYIAKTRNACRILFADVPVPAERQSA